MKILRNLWLGALVVLPLCSMTRVAEARSPEPAAIVYSLVGEASHASPGEAPRTVRLFDRLPAGATLEVGPGSRLMLAFENGRRYELGERSRVTLGPKDLASRSGPVRPLPRVPPLPRLVPIAAQDRPGSRAGAVRIRAERIAGLYPHHGTATLAQATLLRFEPVDGDGRYRVEVQDGHGNLIFEVETTGPEVALPPGVLQPGTHYDWTVRTVDRAGPAAQGRADFVTLSARTAEAREALRDVLTREEDGASLALLAEVDRILGLLAEAREELQTARQASAGDARLAAALVDLERWLSQFQSP